MPYISVNMKQFREKFKVYSDNVKVFEAITKTNGQMFVLDAKPYVDELTEQGIFYTLRQEVKLSCDYPTKE